VVVLVFSYKFSWLSLYGISMYKPLFAEQIILSQPTPLFAYREKGVCRS